MGILFWIKMEELVKQKNLNHEMKSGVGGVGGVI